MGINFLIFDQPKLLVMRQLLFLWWLQTLALNFISAEGSATQSAGWHTLHLIKIFLVHLASR